MNEKNSRDAFQIWHSPFVNLIFQNQPCIQLYNSFNNLYINYELETDMYK